VVLFGTWIWILAAAIILLVLLAAGDKEHTEEEGAGSSVRSACRAQIKARRGTGGAWGSAIGPWQ
jgi:hypothetical protein